MCIVVVLVFLEIFSKWHLFAPKLTVFAGHLLILAGGEMGVFSFSWKRCLTMRSIGTLNDHLGTVFNMIFSDISVLTSLLAVGTAVLTTWTPVLKMPLEVFTKQLRCFKNYRMVFITTIVRAGQLDIATGFEVLVHMS